MNFKYRMNSVINQPPSFLLIILDLNIRFQRLNQALKKIRNTDTKNLPEAEKIRDGLINAVQHKNTVLYLIDVIYKENGVTDEACSFELQQLKSIIENDFLQLIFYPASDLISMDKSLFVMDNQLEKLFFELVTAETLGSQLPCILTQKEIENKKIEFIKKLKNKSSLLPHIIPSPNSSDLVPFFSDIRLYNELYKHHGVKAMYVSSFKILRSTESLDQIQGEEYKNISIQSEIHENYETDDNDTISNDAISDNSNSTED